MKKKKKGKGEDEVTSDQYNLIIQYDQETRHINMVFRNQEDDQLRKTDLISSYSLVNQVGDKICSFLQNKILLLIWYVWSSWSRK